MDKNDRFDRGLEVRRRVMGRERVRSSMTGAGDLAHDLQRLTTEFAWGDIWTRPGLDLKARSIATVAMLIALNRSAELKAHLIGARNSGVSTDELRELILHAAVYCGFPAALEAMRLLHEVGQAVRTDAELGGQVSYFHGEDVIW